MAASPPLTLLWYDATCWFCAGCLDSQAAGRVLENLQWSRYLARVEETTNNSTRPANRPVGAHPCAVYLTNVDATSQQQLYYSALKDVATAVVTKARCDVPPEFFSTQDVLLGHHVLVMWCCDCYRLRQRAGCFTARKSQGSRCCVWQLSTPLHPPRASAHPRTVPAAPVLAPHQPHQRSLSKRLPCSPPRRTCRPP